MSDLVSLDIPKLKVAELKEELTKLGLPVKGLKKELADRLQEAQDAAANATTQGGAEGEKSEASDAAGPPVQGQRAESSTKPDGDGEAAAVGQPIEAKEEQGPADTKPQEEAVPQTVKTRPEAINPEPDQSKIEPPPSASKEVTPKPLSPAQPAMNDMKEASTTGGGVGHTMVEGGEEAIREFEEKVNEKEVRKVEALQPKALDQEVAKEVSKEEVIEQMKEREPSPVKRLSPLPPSQGPSRSRTQSPQPKAPISEARADSTKASPTPATPPLPNTKARSDAEMRETGKKRSRDDEEGEPISKRSKSIYTKPIPPSLSHLIHPPTSTLYITNLRRPLLIPALHDYLLPARHPEDILPTSKSPFASEDHPGLWLSGVKDHAYATYPSVEDAIEIAEKVEGIVWPEDMGQKLHVEFIPDSEVRNLVEQEEAAWANGRQKLSLNISGSGGEAVFELSSGGAIGSRGQVGSRGRPSDSRTASGSGASAPITGTNSVGVNHILAGAPAGPSRGVSIRGRGGFGPPIGLARGGLDRSMVGGRPHMGDGRLVTPMRRTRVRPNLFWKEGPGGAALPT